MGKKVKHLQDAKRDLECDDGEQRSNQRLGKLLKANPEPDHIDAAFNANSDSMRAIRDAPTAGSGNAFHATEDVSSILPYDCRS